MRTFDTPARHFGLGVSGSLLALLLLAAGPALAGGVAVVDTVLTDDGDDDGFADTRETVAMTITVQNTTAGALTGVTARLVSDDPQLLCITAPLVEIGDLAAGEVRQVPTPFVFTVLDVDRALLGLGPLDPLTATFHLIVEAESSSPIALPRKFALDLDLDVAGGSGPTTFFEGFEDGLGTFAIDNMDAGQSVTEDSDGFRCQYSDPDWVNSNSYGHSSFTEECHLGVNVAQADAVFWGLSGPGISPLNGRGFTGFHSLFYGKDLGPPDNWTTPMSNLEAAYTVEPIHLGWDAVAPALAFKHQVSLADTRFFGLPDGLSYDRAVVMAQLADATGAPVGPWIKIEPWWNVYDQQNSPNIFNCTFDPVDDGHNEDDFFDPTDPEREYGPSSTCFPEYTFVNIGETSNEFDEDNPVLGRADGPGEQGIWGPGTWIESRFDLERFRGRSIRLRFLATTIATNSTDGELWEDLFPTLDEEDDGWWVDDVTVTGALSTAATVSVDIQDNSSLPGLPPDSDDDFDGACDPMDNCSLVVNPDQEDTDGDGQGDVCDACPEHAHVVDHDLDGLCATDDNCPFVANPDQANIDGDPAGGACDCNDAQAATYPGAPEVNDGLDNQCPGDPGHGVADEISGVAGFFNPADENEFSWPAQQGATRYQVARAATADFALGCTTFPLTSATFIVDAAAIAPGQVYHYLVRARLPNVGSWGQTSAGVPRTVPCATP